jgi:hypothetical protein
MCVPLHTYYFFVDGVDHGRNILLAGRPHLRWLSDWRGSRYGGLQPSRVSILLCYLLGLRGEYSNHCGSRDLRSLTHVMSQEACHSRGWSGLSPQEHPRAAAAGGVLSHQPATSGGAWAETHRELLESARARFFCPFFIFSDVAEVRHFLLSGFPLYLDGHLWLPYRERNPPCVRGGQEIPGHGGSERGMSCLGCRYYDVTHGVYSLSA